MRKISELIIPGITDRDSAEELIIKVLDAIIERQNKIIELIASNQSGGLPRDVADILIRALENMDIT